MADKAENYFPLWDWGYLANLMNPARMQSPEKNIEALVQIIETETERIARKDAPDASLVRRACAKWSMCLTGSALNDFAKAIEINPDYIPAYGSRATLYVQLGKMDLAAKDQQTCQEIFAKKCHEAMNQQAGIIAEIQKNINTFCSIAKKFWQQSMNTLEQSPPSSTEK